MCSYPVKVLRIQRNLSSRSYGQMHSFKNNRILPHKNWVWAIWISFTHSLYLECPRLKKRDPKRRDQGVHITTHLVRLLPSIFHLYLSGLTLPVTHWSEHTDCLRACRWKESTGPHHSEWCQHSSSFNICIRAETFGWERGNIWCLIAWVLKPDDQALPLGGCVTLGQVTSIYTCFLIHKKQIISPTSYGVMRIKWVNTLEVLVTVTGIYQVFSKYCS